MATITKRCEHSGQAKCRCSWIVRWRDADGKQREKTYPWDRKTVANDWSKKVESDKITGVRTVTSNARFGDYAEKVIRQRAGAATTKSRYLGLLHNHLGELVPRKLATIANDRSGVKTLLLETLPGKGLGRAQIELCQVVITSTVMEAVREKEILSHNLGAIRLPAKVNGESVDPELIAMVTNDVVRKLAGAMPAPWALSVILARGCGLRLGEVLGVKLADFSDDMKALTLGRQVISGTATGPLKSRKPGETRSLPVPSYVAQAVREHVAGHGTRDGFLFAGTVAVFVSDSSFGQAWRKARASAGMPELRFHDLRHAYASHLLAAQVDLPSVSKWLGHRSVDITARIYSHSLPVTFDRARDLLDQEWA